MADTKKGMNSNELRIGSILKDKLTGCLLRVDELTIEGKIVTYVIDRSKYPLPKGWQITPVELTEEILLKCGFVYEDLGDDPPFDIYKKDDIEMWDFNNEYWICDMLDQNGIDREFRYLHQLQNLYFALTGQELAIEL